jgi:hypothetical protein
MGIKTWFACGMVATFGLAATACDSDDAEGFVAGDEAVTPRSTQWNDFRLNDFRLNDFRLNSVRFNDFRLNGDSTAVYIQTYGYDLPGGEYVYNGGVAGGMLQIHSDGGTLDGWDVENTIIDYKIVQNGVTTWKEVWIKMADPIAPYSDVWTYDLDLRVNGGPWEKLCKDSNGNPTQALLIGEAWNPTTGAKISPRPSNVVTFACRTAALAKCVEFGYRPWASKNGVALANHHQACTRMVRADYCGTGQSHTLNGTPVHVLDALGIQTQSPNTPYAVEAEWGPNGATCLNPGNTRLPNQTIGCNIPTCGASFASGGLIQSGKLVQ